MMAVMGIVKLSYVAVYVCGCKWVVCGSTGEIQSGFPLLIFVLLYRPISCVILGQVVVIIWVLADFCWSRALCCACASCSSIGSRSECGVFVIGAGGAFRFKSTTTFMRLCW